MHKIKLEYWSCLEDAYFKWLKKSNMWKNNSAVHVYLRITMQLYWRSCNVLSSELFETHAFIHTARAFYERYLIWLRGFLFRKYNKQDLKWDFCATSIFIAIIIYLIWVKKPAGDQDLRFYVQANFLYPLEVTNAIIDEICSKGNSKEKNYNSTKTNCDDLRIHALTTFSKNGYRPIFMMFNVKAERHELPFDS